MSDDLRLYFFECGSLKTQVQFIKMNQGLGDPYEIPVPFFLITHPRGNVLYDGGNALEVALRVPSMSSLPPVPVNVLASAVPAASNTSTAPTANTSVVVFLTSLLPLWPGIVPEWTALWGNLLDNSGAGSWDLGTIFGRTYLLVLVGGFVTRCRWFWAPLY